MLVVWSKALPARVLASFAPVLRTAPDVQVSVVNDYTVPEGTQTILALGGDALKHLQTEKILAKNRTTTSYRTVPHLRGGIPVLVSYDPSIGDIDHGYFVDLLTDLSLSLRYCQTGKWHPVYGQYRYVPDFSELCASIERQYHDTGQVVEVAKDLETLGLDPYAEPLLKPWYPGAYIVTIQASAQKGTADVIRFVNREHETLRLLDPLLREGMDFLLRSPKVSLRGANFKYDLHWLWRRGKFTCSTFKFDTTIVGSLLDENRSNALDTHVKIYVSSLAGYSDKFDREVDKSRMDLVPPEVLLPYAGGDVDGDLQVATAMKRELLRDPQLTSFYVNILHPAARAFEQVEQGGICVDLPAFQELKADLELEHARLVKEAGKIMGGRIVFKHMDQSRPGGLNLTKASMLCDFMFSPMGLKLTPKMWTEKPDKDGIKRPSTAMEHLEMFADVPEAKAFIDLIRQDSGVMKTYNTYVVGFLEHLRSDGRLHPTYFLYVGNQDEGEGGARTGRLSCKGPAFQCCIGSSLVYTQEGLVSLQEVVERHEQGELLTVLTHTGEWKPVIGSYRNGVQPLLRITTGSGATLTCTANHPWLTDWGFVQAQYLKTGTPVWSLHEETDGGGGEQDRTVDGRGRFGGTDRASKISVPLRVWDDERTRCFKSHWSETEQILWLLQESAVDHAWSQSEKESVPDLLGMATHDQSVLQPEGQGVQELRWARDWRLSCVARLISNFSGRYGAEATRIVLRTVRYEWQLRCKQLQVGVLAGAVSQQAQFGVASGERGPEACERLGQGVRYTPRHIADSDQAWVEPDSSPYHASQAKEAGFDEDLIVSIEEVAPEETFDLTIAGSHSFIANDMVVHNTVPKHTVWAPRIRRCYPAPPGYVVVERDYSQGELRVMACIAHEDNMIAAYRAGRDLHIETAAPFAGFTYEGLLKLAETDVHTFEETRQLGKAGNFGLIFGMMEDGFVIYARSNYGVELTRAEAQKFRDGFFKRYPNVLVYHKQYKSFAHEHKYVRTPLGRIRHLPLIKSPNREVVAKAERQAINSPVQGTLTDMGLWSLAEEHKSGLSAIAPCFGACHDSILNYVPEDRVDELVPRMLDQMENLSFEKVGWHPQLRFLADAKYGPNWGELKKFPRKK